MNGGIIMNRFKVFFIFVFIGILLIPLNSVNADSFKKSKSFLELKEHAKQEKVNIMLYNERGKITNEIHSDGLIIDFKYDKKGQKITEIINSNGVKELLTENDDTTTLIEVYTDEKFLKKELKFNAIELQKRIDSLDEEDVIKNLKKAAMGKLNQIEDTIQLDSTELKSLEQYEDYDINGRNMNSLTPSIWSVAFGTDKFARPSTAMTQADIQSFFNSKNSILKDQIEIWAVINGVAYDTGKRVIPAQVIDKASRDYWINPKVIIATMQKEQSIVTGAPYAQNSSRLYGAMGYLDCYGEDSGFDVQVDGGTHFLAVLWNAGYNKGESAFPYLLKKGTFYNPYASLNNNQNITYDGITYKNYIWVKDCGTYALYCYTPWTSTFSGGYDSGNYLFLTCMRVYWPGSYNGANWD